MKKYRKRWIISDTHFGHNNVILYENRPYTSPISMNQQLIRNWNKLVAKDDLVYHLGDVYMQMSRDNIMHVLNQLNGDIILVLGNHDEGNFNFFRKCGRFLEVSPYPIIVDGWIVCSHQPMYIDRNTPYVNFYGHVHGDPRYASVCENGACVCVEKWDYRPVNFDELKLQVEQLKFPKNEESENED